MHRPKSLKLSPRKSLEIEWDDGKVLDYPFRHLRDSCPCATCKEKKRASEGKPSNPLAILSPSETVPLAIADMRPVGNYAYNIGFSDGHTSGLFTIEYLRQIGRPMPQSDTKTQ
ncbi:gamma-butyrobetaine hydroxylase-like domain-containing protein [Pirellulaceae bacterium SH501]